MADNTLWPIIDIVLYIATQTNQCQFRLMSVYQLRLSLVTLSFRSTQHLETWDGYTPLWETSRQQRGVACAECIPYLAIDRGENDWQREREVSEPPSALRLLSSQNGGSFARFGDETSQ